MKLSFVVPAYNEEAYLGSCLGSIVREIEQTRYEAEIIVVNNASTDMTKAIASSYAFVTVVDEPRKGIVKARDAGYRAAKGDLIANIDADNMLPAGWLEKVVRSFRNGKLVALSGPPSTMISRGRTGFRPGILWHRVYRLPSQPFHPA